MHGCLLRVMAELIGYLASGAVLLFLVGYVLFFLRRHRCRRMVWGCWVSCGHQADKQCVAYRVQGSVNSRPKNF